MFGKEKIEKVIKVEGMMCGHCTKKVEEALKELEEVKKVKASVENKEVKIELKKEIEEGKIENIIEELGYKVIK